jgi:hypothetical protein
MIQVDSKIFLERCIDILKEYNSHSSSHKNLERNLFIWTDSTYDRLSIEEISKKYNLASLTIVNILRHMKIRLIPLIRKDCDKDEYR